MRFALLFLLLIALTFARAQEPSAPPPRLVRLHFALPPLEGTISLGVYDQNGKLVRVLHREDDISEFTAGHDALETTWDGNDDAGHPLPPGRYRAHGFLVAAVKVEGVDDFFNDWVTDENSPHLAHISEIAARAKMLQLTGTAADGKEVHLLFDPATGKLDPTEPAPPEQLDRAKYEGALITPIALTAGRDNTVWAITHVARDSSELQVVQLSVDAQGQLSVLRKLAIAPNEPQPIGLGASPNEDRIFLLEQSPTVERVRSLTLQATAAAPEKGDVVSDWKIDFEKRIVAHQNFALLNDAPIAVPNDQSKTPTPTVQKLRPNPLDRDRPGKVELAVGFDADGSFLETVDGLPLRTVSDNAQIKRALITPHGDQAVDIFQDDGAVVEEFRVSQLDQMMAFDCGEFDLK
ncbi:MAG TPA: hypothetical protein VHW03_06685 [Chthoniobacterales bacterium]|nr:hypothetical protein [Chthoniobacterales bacterium]